MPAAACQFSAQTLHVAFPPIELVTQSEPLFDGILSFWGERYMRQAIRGNAIQLYCGAKAGHLRY